LSQITIEKELEFFLGNSSRHQATEPDTYSDLTHYDEVLRMDESGIIFTVTLRPYQKEHFSEIQIANLQEMIDDKLLQAQLVEVIPKSAIKG
jgi:hypothetical protein